MDAKQWGIKLSVKEEERQETQRQKALGLPLWIKRREVREQESTVSCEQRPVLKRLAWMPEWRQFLAAATGRHFHIKSKK